MNAGGVDTGMQVKRVVPVPTLLLLNLSSPTLSGGPEKGQRNGLNDGNVGIGTVSGERLSNTQIIYSEVRHSPPKGGVMTDNNEGSYDILI